MTNHLVSNQFQYSDGQMVHMDHLPERVDSSTADIQSKTAHVSHGPVSLHFTASNEQLGSVELMSTNSGFQNLMESNNQMRRVESKSGTGEVMLTNLGYQKPFLPSKRKAEIEATPNSVLQHSVMTNKRTMQIGTSPHVPQLLQPSSPNKKSFHVQSKAVSSTMQNLPVSNKKMVQNESMASRSGSQRVQTPKCRTVQNEPFHKVQTDSFGAVRSKMREQLAAALALASQNQDKTTNAENNHAEVSINHQTAPESQSIGSNLGAASMDQHKHQGCGEPFPSAEPCSADKSDDSQGFPAKRPTTEWMGIPTILPDGDVSFCDNFLVKDELLQGNGLSWAFDDMQVLEEKEHQNDEKIKVVCDNGGENASEKGKSPENLASEIEAELFKFFGGVNKKYKEKGRSLLFNLKDSNNPDLRERVMSGKITPAKLCSMTAEELASKELSEWRMAKAEEFAQMVVLPDTDLDRRRLVKKTHKGEYQVVMDEDDGVAVDVSAGSSPLSQTQSKSKDMVTHSPEVDGMEEKENTASLKNSSGNHDLSGSLIIPSDGTDLMQGMIVDELKDAEFLPPILSLDEFMESLDSEPPFEILQVDAGQSTPPSKKENPEADNKVAGSDLTSKDHGGTPVKADEAVVKRAVGETEKPREGPAVMHNVSRPGNASKVEHIWEGELQLTITSSIKTFGVFQSGEKTSITGWPSSLEIKGRVRLGAFEKFIKDLPLSRSRAVMVLHFVLKDNSDESERSNLREAIESYVSEDRLGFAEPAPGVEIYLCPKCGTVVDMLSHYLSKNQTDIFNSSDNGLIGFIVWRIAHHHISSTISPNSSSHHKNSSSLKRQRSASRTHQEKNANANVNVNMMNKARPSSYNRPPSNAVIPAPQVPADDGDDTDIPPGFGPSEAPRDDDDLPEFNFSGNMNHALTPSPSSQNLQKGSSMASRPVDKIRELIHKYGQTGSSVSSGSGSLVDNRDSALGIEPWNDDDDDIPEWQPQMPQQQPQPQFQPRLPSHRFYQQLQPTYDGRNILPQQQMIPTIIPSQDPVNRWAQQLHGNPGNLPSGGQYNRMPGVQAGQRQDGSRSRGF